MNCFHLLTHHDIDHFHHYLGNDQETKKSVWQNETLWLTTCLILLNVDNTISTVTFMNKTTTFQLSTVVGNGLIHGCYIFNDKILLPAWKLCFSLFMAKTFSQFFSVNKSYNGLLCFGSWLANSMTCLNIPRLHLYITVQQDWYMTILSKLLFGTFSGIWLKTRLLHLPY